MSLRKMAFNFLLLSAPSVSNSKTNMLVVLYLSVQVQ